MKLVRVEQQLDSPRLVFYFTAEARVDFRELRTRVGITVSLPDRDASDRGAGRSQVTGRIRDVWSPAVLHDLAPGVRTDLDQDGETTESELEPLETVRPLRTPEMLPSL